MRRTLTIFFNKQCSLTVKWLQDVNGTPTDIKDVWLPPYLSYTCGWEVSLADLCAGGSSERGVDPGQTWWSRDNSEKKKIKTRNTFMFGCWVQKNVTVISVTQATTLQSVLSLNWMLDLMDVVLQWQAEAWYLTDWTQNVVFPIIKFTELN